MKRCFNEFKSACRLATRRDKPAESFLGFIHFTSMHLRLAPPLVNMAEAPVKSQTSRAE